MTSEHNDLLTENRVEIVEDLLVDDVLNFLQSKMVFDSHDAELIKVEKTSRRQAEKLLDLLSTKSDAAFYCFRESLEEPYPHLVELLQEDVRSPRKISDAKDILERGKYVMKLRVIDLSHILTNNGTESRLGWTKIQLMYENVHPNLAPMLLFVCTEVECGKGL